MRQILRRSGGDEAVRDQGRRVLAHLLERAQQGQRGVRAHHAVHLSGRLECRGRVPGHLVDLVLELIAHDADQGLEDLPGAHLGQRCAGGRRRPAPGHHPPSGNLHVLHQRLGAPVGAGRQDERLLGAPPARHPGRGQRRACQGQGCDPGAVSAHLGDGVGQDPQVRTPGGDGHQGRVSAHHQARPARRLHRGRDRRAIRVAQARHATGPVGQALALLQAGTGPGGPSGPGRAVGTLGDSNLPALLLAPLAAGPPSRAPRALVLLGLGHRLRQRAAHRRAHSGLRLARQPLLERDQVPAATDDPAPGVQGREAHR